MPIQVKKLVYLNSNGLLNRVEDGAITNIGGTDRSSFTVGGRPVLLDYSGGGGPVIGNVIGHVHFQYAASTVWTITHNKNSWHPVLTVWNASLLEIIPMQVQTLNENVVKIFFTSPIAGKAVLCFVDESSTTLDGTVFTLPDPNPPTPPNPVFVNTVNGLWGDITLDQVNLTAGANVTITGTYPNLTIAATGGGGGGSPNYTHTFVRGTDFTGSTITVTHNLGKRFNIVQIYDSNGKQVIPDEITATSINVTTLELSLAFFGYSTDFTVVISPGAF